MREFEIAMVIYLPDATYKPIIKVNSDFMDEAILKATTKISQEMCISKNLIVIKDIHELHKKDCR